MTRNRNQTPFEPMFTAWSADLPAVSDDQEKPDGCPFRAVAGLEREGANYTLPILTCRVSAVVGLDQICAPLANHHDGDVRVDGGVFGEDRGVGDP